MADSDTCVPAKRCPRCGVTKPAHAFHRSSSEASGLQARCIECNRQHQKLPSSRRVQRNSHLLREFGITLEVYEGMLKAQNGVCAICSRPPNTRALHVDHDHTSGEVRGLLCFPCNHAIGLLGDDPERLTAAAFYLSRGDSNG